MVSLQYTRWLAGTVYLLGFPPTIPCLTSPTSVLTVGLERGRPPSATCDPPQLGDFGTILQVPQPRSREQISI